MIPATFNLKIALLLFPFNVEKPSGLSLLPPKIVNFLFTVIKLSDAVKSLLPKYIMSPSFTFPELIKFEISLNVFPETS